MIKIVTVAQMRAIEAAADRAGLSYAQMMETAGRAVAQAVEARLDDPPAHKVLVLCGPGNNGGDGLVAAHYLANAGCTVWVYFPALPDENNVNLQRVRDRGLPVENLANDISNHTSKNGCAKPR